MKLVWRAKALADLETIISYIAERNPVAAERLLDAIERCIERFPDDPFLYRPGRVKLLFVQSILL